MSFKEDEELKRRIEKFEKKEKKKKSTLQQVEKYILGRNTKSNSFNRR